MTVQAQLPNVTCDRLQMKQVISNLVSNAVKFNTRPDPAIEISWKDRGNDYVFSVKDNGIGIDPQYFDKIFQVFQRLHRREDFEGTGAGLAICKKIIEAHGGEIWVESAPNAGSTFSFSLPKNRTAKEGSR
jgi:light-regulated signal transduction histidine kinase (bacteriophytochrome)